MIVDNLEKAGLVRRERSAVDRRYVQVQLTAEGRRLIKKLFPRHAQTIADEMSVLAAAEQEGLARLCCKLGRGISAGGAAVRAAVPSHETRPEAPASLPGIEATDASRAALEPRSLAASGKVHRHPVPASQPMAPLP